MRVCVCVCISIWLKYIIVIYKIHTSILYWHWQDLYEDNTCDRLCGVQLIYGNPVVYYRSVTVQLDDILQNKAFNYCTHQVGRDRPLSRSETEWPDCLFMVVWYPCTINNTELSSHDGCYLINAFSTSSISWHWYWTALYNLEAYCGRHVWIVSSLASGIGIPCSV
jgi:hypothetical protein